MLITPASPAELRCAIAPCSLGQLLVAASDAGLCAALLGDTPAALLAELQARFPRAAVHVDAEGLAAMHARVRAVVDGGPADAGLPLAPCGTAFQRRVWQTLCTLPPGSTLSYAELARRLGQPTATRAVAGACAANPLAVLVPCHRVLRSDGGLGGYRWGLARKRTLLAREGGGLIPPDAPPP